MNNPGYAPLTLVHTTAPLELVSLLCLMEHRIPVRASLAGIPIAGYVTPLCLDKLAVQDTQDNTGVSTYLWANIGYQLEPVSLLCLWNIGYQLS